MADRATLVVRRCRAARMTAAQREAGDGPLALLEDATVAAAGGVLIHVGGGDGLERAPGCVEIDAEGALVTPGLVEPHTHLLFAGDRAGEHAQRLAGASYLEIAQRRGGIRAI